ncbi:unnamed protein product [Penicillium salamii]|uniref:Transcription factor domain-containing protein n=1 Tax=Penicillium salamii TaxID=1612424 RepID=A0A9W4NRR0_9EURO|nr:unnamed protein product [Penicillium salamii]
MLLHISGLLGCPDSTFLHRLSAYCIYIHPFLPIMSPSLTTGCYDHPVPVRIQGEVEDLDPRSLPHWPRSSLTLALSAILSLIPIAQDPNSSLESSIRSRRLHANLCAKAALGQVENEIDTISIPTTADPYTIGEEGQFNTPVQLHPVLALVLLSVYEYCQRGSLPRMRSRANQAITTAMDLSLHQLGADSTEAQRRAWWNASPIICLGDSRISTPLPTFQNAAVQPWALLLESEKAILSVSETFDECLVNPPTDSAACDRSKKIAHLDSHITSIIKQLDLLKKPKYNGAIESSAAQGMWRVATVARIRLHRSRAFMDIPLFLDKYCDLAAIQERMEATSAFDPRRTPHLDSVFPFTEQDSSLVCLKSAQVIARTLENIPIANPHLHPFVAADRKPNGVTGKAPYMLPFFMCAAMQGFYVLLMLHYRLRAALESKHLPMYYYLLHSPQIDSESQDAERLLRELRQGMESIIGAVKLAHMFEGVGSMSQEICVAHQSTLIED